jgi:hypothetical protein
MTTPINHVSQLAGVIRTQLAGRGTRAGRPAPRASTRPSAGRSDELARLIELRVGQIAQDDPDRGRKAFRIFLEAVLLSELGEHLVNDVHFHQLVDEVQRAMHDDPGLAPVIEQAIGNLLSGAA